MKGQLNCASGKSGCGTGREGWCTQSATWQTQRGLLFWHSVSKVLFELLLPPVCAARLVTFRKCLFDDECEGQRDGGADEADDEGVAGAVLSRKLFAYIALRDAGALDLSELLSKSRAVT